MLLKEATQDSINSVVASGFATVATVFIQESLAHMIPWLIASCAVILCDLAFGIRKSILMGDEVRISSAVRRTMGKMVTYFSFVCMVCMVSVAAGGGYAIDRWSCLFVCFLEFCSIVSNILKPKGITLNLRALLAVVAGKVSRIGKEEIDEIIENEKKEG